MTLLGRQLIRLLRFGMWEFIALTWLRALMGAAIGAAASLLTTRMQLRHQLDVLRVERKTEDQAEQVAVKLLSHEKFFERSFDAISTAIGGFEDDELRKVLVWAGAIRRRRKDGSEWWILIDREIKQLNDARENEGRPAYEG